MNATLTGTAEHLSLGFLNTRLSKHSVFQLKTRLCVFLPLQRVDVGEKSSTYSEAAVRVDSVSCSARKFGLPTLVRHTHQKDRVASNSHSVTAVCLSFITPSCVQKHIRIIKLRRTRAKYTHYSPSMSERKCTRFCCSLPCLLFSPHTIISRDAHCKRSQTHRLRARAHALPHKSPIHMPTPQ